MTATEADLDAFRSDLWQARYGDPRFGHEDFTPFPALIARADELGDPYWSYIARLEAAYAGIWAGKAVDVLTLVAWLLRERDRRGPELDLEDWQLYQLNTTVADLLESIADLPELSLEQAEALVVDWERRTAGTEFGTRVMPAQVRAAIAVHRGDESAAHTLLDALDDFTPPAGTCEEGARGGVAAAYSRLGDHARALELSEPDLIDNGDRCGFFPAETQASLIAAWAAQGRRDEVIAAAASIARIYGPFPVLSKITDAIVALLRVDAFTQAHQLAVTELGRLDRAFTPLAEAEQAAALAAVFASAADADPDAVVLRREHPGAPAQLAGARELADDLADRARSIAGRFDVRNASSAVSRRIEEILALRAAAAPASGVKPVARRSAEELLAGMSAFALTSPRRSEACADALAGRVDELSGRHRLRAEMMLATRRQAEDPLGVIAQLRDAAERAEPISGSLAGQARLMADRLAVEYADLDPEAISGLPASDPSWPALSAAGYCRNLALISAELDPQRAAEAVADGMAALDAADRGERPYADADRAGEAESVPADTASARVELLMRRAALTDLAGGDDRPHVDAALTFGRRAVELASTADQRLSAQADLVWVLGVAAQMQAGADPQAAIRLLDEAVEHARFAQRAHVLRLRGELRGSVGDLDGAFDDNEQAIAVLTVEGLDAEADAAVLDQVIVRLERDDEPRAIIETVRPVIDRVTERGDEMGALHAVGLLGRAQVAAGLSEDAVGSFGRVLDAASGEEHPGYIGQIYQLRAGEEMDLRRYADAYADLQAAIACFEQIDGLYEIGAALRMAAVSAHFAGDDPAAQDALTRAESVYDRLSADRPVDFERARLDFARADIVRRDDADRAEVILDSVIERAQTAQWLPLAVNALYLSACIALDREDDRDRHRALAERRIADGLRLDPDHGGFVQLRGELDERDQD